MINNPNLAREVLLSGPEAITASLDGPSPDRQVRQRHQDTAFAQAGQPKSITKPIALSWLGVTH